MHLATETEAQNCTHLIDTSKSRATVIMTLKKLSQVCLKPDVVFTSPAFDCLRAAWKVRVCPSGLRSYESEGKILFVLDRVSSSVLVHNLSLKVGFRDKFRQTVRERAVDVQFYDGAESAGVRTTVELRELLEGDTEDILLEDCLTIYCKLRDADVDDEIEDDLQIVDDGYMLCNLDALCRDYEKLFNSGDYSDVTLCTNKGEIPAHRAILGARSETFSNMLKQNSPSNVYHIDHVDHESLKNLLFFIYTGKLQELSSDNVFRLFAAAEKFVLEDLKVMCKKHMKENLSVTNVCDVIILSEKYNLEDLSSMARRFLHQHASEIVESKEWSYFEVECPDLALTLLRSFVSTRKAGKENEPTTNAENSDATVPFPEQGQNYGTFIKSIWICILFLLLTSFVSTCVSKISSNREL